MSDSNQLDSKKYKSNKKNTKSKAVDFMQYAEEKGIDFDIKYEEAAQKEVKVKEKPLKQEKQPERQQEKQMEKKFEFKKEREEKVEKVEFTRVIPKKMEMSNKFDQPNQFVNPFVLLGPHMMRDDFAMSSCFPIYADTVEPTWKSYSIAESVDYYFSVDNLNKDGFFRLKLDSDGWVLAQEVLNFKKMKKENVTLADLLAIINKSEILEKKEVGSQLYIRNKEWDLMKKKLISMDEISSTNIPQMFQKTGNNYFQPNLNQMDANQYSMYMMNVQNNMAGVSLDGNKYAQRYK